MQVFQNEIAFTSGVSVALARDFGKQFVRTQEIAELFKGFFLDRLYVIFVSDLGVVLYTTERNA